MKNNRNIFLSFLISLLFISLLASCNTGDENGDEGTGGETEEKGSITIGLNNWAENVAVSNMWKVLLEEQGYDVTLSRMEKAPVWLGITQGDLDIAPEVWLPHTDKDLMNKYGDQLEMRDVWYENTGLGLVVPTYMNINSIEELNNKKDELGLERIVGIDPGASLTAMTKTAIEEYGLNYELMESSGPAMMSELSRAYANEEPIVVTLWNPHWAFSEYDLKYLEDPKNIYGEPDDIHYMTRTGFGDDFPEVVSWMNDWKMDDQSLGDLMAVIKETDPEEGAQQWVEDNRELVDSWITE